MPLLELNPDVVMSDFELALIQAVSLNFPNTKHRGCYYVQAIWRKVQGLGLQDEYTGEESSLKKFVQKMTATAFCPQAFMRLAWQGTKQEAPDVA